MDLHEIRDAIRDSLFDDKTIEKGDYIFETSTDDGERYLRITNRKGECVVYAIEDFSYSLMERVEAFAQAVINHASQT